MSDYEDDDVEIDYNPDEVQDDGNEDDLGIDLENNFLEAETDPDPIKCYREIIDIDISNSTEHKWAYKCYEKLSVIYIQKNDLEEFKKCFEKISTFYNKIEYADKVDTMRTLIMEINKKFDYNTKLDVFNFILSCLKKEELTREYLNLGVEYCKILLVHNDYEKLRKLLPEIFQVLDTTKEEEYLKNIKLQMIIMEIQLCKVDGRQIEIKDLYQDAQRLMVDQVFEDKYLTAIINEEGGKISMRQKDFDEAFRQFKSSFQYYKESGNKEALKVLKYSYVSLLLVKKKAFISEDEVKDYKNDKDLMNLVNLYEAYRVMDIEKFNKIWFNEIVKNEKDPFIQENFKEILYGFRINYTVKKMKAFKQCKFNALIKELGININEMFGIAMYIVRNNLVKSKIDFVNEQIISLDDRKTVGLMDEEDEKAPDVYNSLYDWEKLF